MLWIPPDLICLKRAHGSRALQIIDKQRPALRFTKSALHIKIGQKCWCHCICLARLKWLTSAAISNCQSSTAELLNVAQTWVAEDLNTFTVAVNWSIASLNSLQSHPESANLHPSKPADVAIECSTTISMRTNIPEKALSDYMHKSGLVRWWPWLGTPVISGIPAIS